MEATQLIGRHLGLAGIALRRGVEQRMRDDRGEGVISMAIAVLIIAAIGGVLWVFFNNAANTIGNDVETQIEGITGTVNG